MMNLTVDPYPNLELAAFVTTFPQTVSSIISPQWLTEKLSIDAEAPLQRMEEIRLAVRDLLRHAGNKPTGRGKPASEYLIRASQEEHLQSINPAVDACNVVSLHSGLPISVIDLDLASPPFHIRAGDQNAQYVFNASGQEIKVGGLLCLYDAMGPCANAVKDAQRTKTRADTTRTLNLIWGLESFSDHTHRALNWYRELLGALSAETTLIVPEN